MIKSLLLLMLLGAPSYTTDTTVDNPATDVIRDIHCVPSDQPTYCDCTWQVYDAGQDVLKKTTQRVDIDPSVHSCEDLPMTFALHRKVPPQAHDRNRNLQAIDQEVCDLKIAAMDTIGPIYLGTKEYVDVEAAINVVTQEDRSGLSLGIFYYNSTQEVPDWIQIDEQHNLIVIHATHGHVGKFDFILQAYLGNCSDSTIVSFTVKEQDSGTAPVIVKDASWWENASADAVGGIIAGICLGCFGICILAYCCVKKRCLFYRAAIGGDTEGRPDDIENKCASYCLRQVSGCIKGVGAICKFCACHVLPCILCPPCYCYYRRKRAIDIEENNNASNMEMRL